MIPIYCIATVIPNQKHLHLRVHAIAQPKVVLIFHIYRDIRFVLDIHVIHPIVLVITCPASVVHRAIQKMVYHGVL